MRCNSIFFSNRLLCRVSLILACIFTGLSSSAAPQTPVINSEKPETNAEPEFDDEHPFSNPVDSIVFMAGDNIEIDITPELLENILQQPEAKKIIRTTRLNNSHKTTGKLQKIRGYRVQVFGDGRKQGLLENMAKQRGNAIVAKFPKYRGQIYTFSQAPNWYTRVGNFQTSSEAQKALSELKSAFPKFAGEMRIVNSNIYVLK